MRTLSTLILILHFYTSNSQNTIGLPDIINYNKQSYKAGLQNWDIRQDKNGIIYVANNEGLLCFDGSTWQLLPLPNRTIVRSLEITKDNRIYVGGQGELGFFSPNQQGVLKYKSLLELIPQNDRRFGDVWDIISTEEGVFFRCSDKIFKLKQNKIISYPAPNEWGFMGIEKGQLYAQDFFKGLLIYKGANWEPVSAINTLPTNDPVTAILPGKEDTLLIATLKNGLYTLYNSLIAPLKSKNQTIFKSERVYSAIALENNRTAIATNNSGVYIIDQAGNIIQRFSRGEGLQHNNILSIFSDNKKNLWLGLDNGIDLITYNSAIKQIVPGLEDASGYTAAFYKQNLYIGTSGGLYRVKVQDDEDLSFSIGEFIPIANTKGQSWNLSIVNNQLLLGHHDGGFLIENNSSSQFSTTPGIWNYIPLGDSSNKRMAVGHYKGVQIYEWAQEKLIRKESVDGFEESSRYMSADQQGNLWVSHPYHGVFKIHKSDTQFVVETITEKNGLPSLLNNHLFKVNNSILLGTEKGVYTLNEKANKFYPSEEFSKLLGSKSIRYLKEDSVGNCWFVQDKSIGVINKERSKITYIPELSNKLLSGFEMILPIDEKNIFVSGERGIFHVNYIKYKDNILDLKVQIRKVSLVNKKDSLLYGGYGNLLPDNSTSSFPIIGSEWKTIRINYTSTLYGQQAGLEYAYRLKGFESNWSSWSNRTEKEYTNLKEGKYVFEVKSRNNLGSESAVTTYTFQILPPWHRTSVAYVVYVFLFAILFFSLYKLQQRKFQKQKKKIEEEKKRLLYIHELERGKTENELVTLKNEKLEAEINFKNSELASSTMHLVKKGELLTKIKEELSRVIKTLENPVAINEIKKVLKSVGEDDKIDQEWETFAKHFDKVHSEFVVNLKEKYPALSANEVKLCIYLRMNLSSKEIAQLMSISVRGVEISRYRLRKKIGIRSEVNLFDHLMAIGSKDNKSETGVNE
ncbi:MAG: ligand-binding sensor domain-containing protein [Chitinophagaceae bacterium]